MNTRTVLGLIVSALFMAAGIAVNNDPIHPSTLGVLLTVLGGSGAAVCITLWAARAMRLDRVVARARRDGPRIQTLISQLIDAAAQAESRGVLTLTDRKLPECQSIFLEGVEMLIRAEQPAVIRAKLDQRAETRAAGAAAARKRMLGLCRTLPVIALSMALATIIWMLATLNQPSQLGSLTPLALIVAVYGAFALAAVSAEMGDRLLAAAAEDVLAGALVIETLVAIRAGENAERIGAMLRGYVPAIRETLPPMKLRRAA